MINGNIAALLYLVAGVLFILALRGLSSPASSRRGNTFGMGDKVVTIGHYGITAKSTGKHFESDWTHVLTIRNGKGVKFQEFADTAAFYKAGRV